MTEEEKKARERRLRRAAKSRGYRLVRSRSQDPKSPGYGGYLVIDAEQDAVILGAEPTLFSASLDHVESFLLDGSSPRQRRRVAQPPDKVL
jgi:hypothetical protein